MGSGITAGAVLGWPADFHALAGHLICHPRRANDNRKITQLCVCPPPHPAGSCSLQLAPSAQCRHPFSICAWVSKADLSGRLTGLLGLWAAPPAFPHPVFAFDTMPRDEGVQREKYKV